MDDWKHLTVASVGGLIALLGALESSLKKTFTEYTNAAFLNLRIGPMETAKAENFNAFKIASITGSDTGEFSVEHGIGRTPYLILPCADLSAVGSAIIPLEVTRAADDRRIYLKSTSTSAAFGVYIE